MKFWRPLRNLGLVAALLFTASCGTDGPTGPSQSSAPAAVSSTTVRPDASILSGLTGGLLNPLLKGLLTCAPQPYQRTSQTIGAAGGTIRLGRNSLVIPRGALNGPVNITMETPSDEVASVRFGPEGLQFNQGHSPTLTLDYSSCPIGRLQLLKHVAYTNERLQILDLLLGSIDNLLAMQVSAPIQHFSRYAVAW